MSYKLYILEFFCHTGEKALLKSKQVAVTLTSTRLSLYTDKCFEVVIIENVKNYNAMNVIAENITLIPRDTKKPPYLAATEVGIKASLDSSWVCPFLSIHKMTFSRALIFNQDIMAPWHAASF